MPLYIVGLGLYDEKDITVRGLEVIRSSSHVYLECYTSILFCHVSQLEKFYQRSIQCMDREHVEQDCNEMLNKAETSDVALLVVGDPLCATTHADLIFRAQSRKIPVHVIHNASVLTAIASCGLQMYSFGEVVSIPFFTPQWTPESIYDKIKKNKQSGLHTLCLLDIKVKEQSIENMMKGNSIYEPPRYMTIHQAIEQLFLLEAKRHEKVCTKDCRAFGVARLGDPSTQRIVSGSLHQLKDYDFGSPLHSLILCAPKLHDMEESFFSLYHIENIQ